MKKILTGILLLIISLGLVACGNGDDPKPEPIDKEVELNVAINYTSGGKLMSITYQGDTPYQSTINGKTYNKGDLLPAWEAIAEKLKINFVDKATTSDANTNAQFDRLVTTNFAGVDLVNGTGAKIGPEGVKGNFVDLGKHLNKMPNLSKFLNDNPSVKVSMTSDDNGIYFTPYFDGFGEMENMILARIDWIEDILDAEDTSLFDAGAGVAPDKYTRRQVTTPVEATIKVATKDGKTREVVKKYDENILDVLAAVENPTGKSLADAFRNHISSTYGEQGYEKLSHVFTGVDAAYDTDELIALMYVVKSNPKYLTREFAEPLEAIEVLFPREHKGNRIRNLFRMTEIFGLRGVFSRHEWMYFGTDGKITDIRGEDRFIEAMNDLSHLYQDGLIVQNPEDGGNWRSVLLNGANGFITYDYNASSTADGLINKGRELDATLKFQAILPPVVEWFGDGNFFHFTESARSVKNEAWGIPKHVENDPDKLSRALRLIDDLYDYSTEDSVGTIHLYGPKGWTDGTLAYGEETVYKLSDKFLAEMKDLAGGNHINYLRQYVGATLPIGHIRSLGLEFQTLSEEGTLGIERINTAVKAGTLLLAGQTGKEAKEKWYDLSPTFFPISKEDQESIEAAATFRNIFQDDALVTILKNGFSGSGGSLTKQQYLDSMMYNEVNAYETIFIQAYRDALDRIK